MSSDDGQKFDIFTKINQNPQSKDKDNKKGKKEEKIENEEGTDNNTSETPVVETAIREENDTTSIKEDEVTDSTSKKKEKMGKKLE